MKTFEERYTAWIDGKLEGAALTSFELELSRRASAGEARADKEDATRLRWLLTTHLKAPAMTNVEFFSHQLRERIEAERMTGRRREEERPAWIPVFSWPFARLAGLGAAAAFVVLALCYGMIPRNVAPTVSPQVAVQTPVPAYPVATAGPAVLAPDQLAARLLPPSANDGKLALASPAPPPIDLNGGDIQVVRVPSPSNNVSATALQLKDQNANVLWINGLDYMPTVMGESPASAAPAPAASAVP